MEERGEDVVGRRVGIKWDDPQGLKRGDGEKGRGEGGGGKGEKWGER